MAEKRHMKLSFLSQGLLIKKTKFTSKMNLVVDFFQICIFKLGFLNKPVISILYEILGKFVCLWLFVLFLVLFFCFLVGWAFKVSSFYSSGFLCSIQEKKCNVHGKRKPGADLLV